MSYAQFLPSKALKRYQKLQQTKFFFVCFLSIYLFIYLSIFFIYL